MNINNQDEVLMCRGCLSTDGNLFNINTRGLLTEYYLLIGYQISQYDSSPQYLCHICSALLHKFTKFRDKCLRNKSLLENMQINFNIILRSQLKQLNIHSNAYYQRTKTQIHDYHPDSNVLTNNTVIFFENKETIKPLIHIDNKTDVKIEEDIDESTNLEVKSEDANLSQISKQYDSDQEFLNDINCHVKDKIESDSSDDQALVTFKSSNKPKTNQTKKRKRIILNKDTTIRQNLVRNSKLDTKESESAEISQKRVKRFETKQNLDTFERMFNVQIIILSKEEQLKDVLDRKTSVNYLHSPYRCEFCFKGFMDEDNLNKHHMAQHDPSRGSIVCEFCKFRYKDKRGLNQHLKKHRLKFACRQCKYVSRTTFNAKEHHKMHSGQIHECKQCAKSYEKLSSYLSHMRIHHPSEFVWCDYCGEPFIGEFGLNGHKKRAHRNLKFPPEALCLLCKTNFTNLEALDKHANGHNKGACDVSCVHCGLGFDARLELKDHLLEVHRARKKYSCEKCLKTFSKESLYSAHYRRMHVDTIINKNDKNMAQWMCEICGKALPSKCLLVYHQRNHTGERPYQCAECPKSFTMRKLLQSHMRVHTSARPYSCKTCPKTFKGLSALRSHENIHAGARTKISSRSIQM